MYLDIDNDAVAPGEGPIITMYLIICFNDIKIHYNSPVGRIA